MHAIIIAHFQTAVTHHYNGTLSEFSNEHFALDKIWFKARDTLFDEVMYAEYDQSNNKECKFTLIQQPLMWQLTRTKTNNIHTGPQEKTLPTTFIFTITVECGPILIIFFTCIYR